MLQVFVPVAFVASAVRVLVGAVPVGFVFNPVAFVNVAVDVGELAFLAGVVLAPEAFVDGAIRPNLSAKAIPHITNPFACIGCTRAFECVSWSLFTTGFVS